MFTGYPELIPHDQGRNLQLISSKNMFSQLGIITKDNPVDSHTSSSICERYRSIIRRFYNKLKVYIPDVDKKTRLSIPVHSVNKTIEPDGPTPCLLLFGSVLRILLRNVSTRAPAQKQCSEAMAAARKEMETITAQRRVASPLKHRTGALPHPMYEFGDSVCAWREESNHMKAYTRCTTLTTERLYFCI